MTSEAIKVDTRQFAKKHGHEPRGRFLWTFRIGVGEKLYVGDDGKARPLYFSKRGEYEACLAAAVESAREMSASAISVSSVVYGQDDDC